jgi:hypothetical protein
LDRIVKLELALIVRNVVDKDQSQIVQQGADVFQDLVVRFQFPSCV